MKSQLFIWCSIIFLFFQNCSEQSATTPKANTTTQTKSTWFDQSKHKIDSTNKVLEWRILDCGLWKSKFGDIAFKTQDATEYGSIDLYISFMEAETRIPLREVIDTLTFEYLGSSFYRDKNSIFTIYEMASGGRFWRVKDADLATFEVIGDCYAKDKNYIFGERAMIMKQVDYQTFTTKKGIGCFAKDKNGYYFWDDLLDVNEIDAESRKMILKLDEN